jgi:FKBP-type peptidyl-prolyl cis-trans isomerase
MRFLSIVVLAGILHPCIAAAQNTPASKEQKTAAAPKQEVSSTLDEKSKRNYTMGVSIGESLKKQQTVELDQDFLLRGLRDSLSGSKLQLTEAEIGRTLTAMGNELRAKQFLAGKELAEKNKKEGEEFLAANKKKAGVVSLPSGLQYKIVKAGEGKKPTAEDVAVCQYRATLLDGTEFDNSYKMQTGPVNFPVKAVIKGWTEALQLMPAGSKWQLFVPPDLAYGENGVPRAKIGPNAALIFEVELISVQAAPDGPAPKGGS